MTYGESGASPAAGYEGVLTRMRRSMESHRAATAIAGASLAGLAAFGGLELADSHGNGSPDGKGAGAADRHANPLGLNVCDDIELTNSAFGFRNDAGKVYTLLPPAPNNDISQEAGTQDADKAASYIKSWFDTDGPLAHKADRASLALLDAVVGQPATEKNIDNSYEYHDQFSADMKHLTGEKAQSVATKLCQNLVTVVGSTFAYSAAAIANKQKYTEFMPVYGEIAGQSDAVDVKSEQLTASADTPGIVFKVQNYTGGDNKVHGFTEVIVQGTGEVDVLGVLPQPQAAPSASNSRESGAPSQHEQSQNGTSPSPSQQEQQNSSNGQSSSQQSQNRQAKNGGGGSGTHAGTGGGHGGETGGGCNGSCGTGTHGGSGGGSGSTGGCTSCGGGNGGPTGGPTGGGSTPTSTSGPKPSPSPTETSPAPVPTTPTPPRTTTPSPSPTTSSPTPTPKGSEPSCVPNPPYVICSSSENAAYTPDVAIYAPTMNMNAGEVWFYKFNFNVLSREVVLKEV